MRGATILDKVSVKVVFGQRPKQVFGRTANGKMLLVDVPGSLRITRIRVGIRERRAVKRVESSFFQMFMVCVNMNFLH